MSEFKGFLKTYANAQIADANKHKVAISTFDHDEYRPFNGIVVENLDASTAIKVFLDNNDNKFFIVQAASWKSFNVPFSEVRIQRIDANTIAADKVFTTVLKGVTARKDLEMRGLIS